MSIVMRWIRWLASIRLVTETPAPSIGEGTLEVIWNEQEQRIGLVIPQADGTADAMIVLMTPDQTRTVGKILLHAAESRDGRGVLNCKPSEN